MKILLINPNVTEAITEVMAAEARRCASPGTEIIPATSRFGTLYIENRAEAAIASHAVLEIAAQRAPQCDAIIVSAFGDPGLAAVRELVDVPVVGICESALLTARMLGRRYSIVCLTRRLRAWYMECVTDYGLDDRLASVRALERPPSDITRAKDEVREHLVQLCTEAIEMDDAEVIIFGGGPIAGLAAEVQDRIPVPTLDGVSCAVRMAETLVGLAARVPAVGSFARPAPKPTKGLSPSLAAYIEHREK